MGVEVEDTSDIFSNLGCKTAADGNLFANRYSNYLILGEKAINVGVANVEIAVVNDFYLFFSFESFFFCSLKSVRLNLFTFNIDSVNHQPEFRRSHRA